MPSHSFPRIARALSHTIGSARGFGASHRSAEAPESLSIWCRKRYCKSRIGALRSVALSVRRENKHANRHLLRRFSRNGLYDGKRAINPSASLLWLSTCFEIR